ncbi:IclR family transcriptional regulator [Pseudonocardia benzenivorans]|uniref:IclR family transcriptional regulator n=1 Tax=Pseudonocardia benzenivorans TaxID=228005 RepID=A0ABW3VRN8_9PSEU
MKRTKVEPGVPPKAPAAVPQYPIESVDNALKVLLLLGERSELRLTDVSEYLGVASSTAHRLLAMLQYRGFVRQNERTKAYGPGTALTGVAFSILQRFDFRSVLRPYLERLNTELAETVHLGLLDGTTVRFIDALESPKAVRVASRLGRSMPAHATSTGKALLAQLSTAELHALYPEEELEGLTSHSVRLRSALEAQLATARKRGYATSTEESEAGVSSVAVAFPFRGTPARIAFNAAVPASRMSAADQRAIGATLRATVDEAAELLHG